MKIYIISILALILSLGFLYPSVAQAQNEEVTSDLKVYKITTDEDGQQVTKAVSTTEPGDTLEYRLSYTNNLDDAISNLKPVLPIPEGVRYLANTAKPELYAASLDTVGNSFQAFPIKKEVILSSGLKVKREATPGTYRRLQWNVSSLGAGESAMFRARVWVIKDQ